MILTEELIEQGRRLSGGFSYKQIEILGDSQKNRGWLNRLIGKNVSKEQYDLFLYEKNHLTKKQKKSIKFKSESRVNNKKHEQPKEQNRKRWLSKKEFFNQYKDKRWIQLREMILKRDNHKCVRCGNSNGELNVHHLSYDRGNVWETPPEKLITLCKACHKTEHGRDVNGKKLTKINDEDGFFTKEALSYYNKNKRKSWYNYYNGWKDSILFLNEMSEKLGCTLTELLIENKGKKFDKQ
jgi:5-methylcytosine-specific restriction endonuclease McrA